MLLNCDPGEDNWESLSLQGDQSILKEINPELMLPANIGRTDAEAKFLRFWPSDAESWLYEKDHAK